MHPESYIFEDNLLQKTTAVIKINPEVDEAFIILAGEAQGLLKYATARVIQSNADLGSAVDDLSILVSTMKTVEEKRQEWVHPVNEHVKAINAAFKTITQPLEEANSLTRTKINVWRQEQERRRREQEEINRLRQEAAEREAALQQKPVEPVQLVEVAPAPVKRVHTGMGSMGTASLPKFRVVDFKQLPDEYKMADEKKIGQVVRATKGKISIPGVEVYFEDSLRVTPRKPDD